jgi:NADPH2:quinone reductase
MDAVGGQTGLSAFDLLRPGGRFLVFGTAGGAVTQVDPAAAEARGVTVASFFGPPTGSRSPEALRRHTRAVMTAAAEGRLRPFVGQTFPLAEAAAAHRAIAARATVGKTVLVP